MALPILLYSANSWLAFAIAERFYNDEHYVWCTPHFNVKSVAGYSATTPPTSRPGEIYLALAEEVKHGDRHSAKIKENKTGILKGATLKRLAGVIVEAQEKEIAAIVELAETRDFRPLLYVIPYPLVAAIVIEVPVAERAHPLSHGVSD